MTNLASHLKNKKQITKKMKTELKKPGDLLTKKPTKKLVGILGLI